MNAVETNQPELGLDPVWETKPPLCLLLPIARLRVEREVQGLIETLRPLLDDPRFWHDAVEEFISALESGMALESLYAWVEGHRLLAVWSHEVKEWSELVAVLDTIMNRVCACEREWKRLRHEERFALQLARGHYQHHVRVA